MLRISARFSARFAGAVLLSFASFAIIGCASSASSQRPPDAKASVEAKAADKSEAIAQRQSTRPPATTVAELSPSEAFQRDLDRLGLKEGMPYEEVRNYLLDLGWRTHFEGDEPNRNDATVRELLDLGYEEVKDCAGTGLGPCRFEFINEGGQVLVISTIQNGSGNNRERFLWRWFLVQGTTPESGNIEDFPDGPPFYGTRYFNFYGGNGTGQSITIEQDGTVTVERHGTMSSSVEYQGVFSNPIIFPDQTGLLFKEGKIYRLRADGQFAQNCLGEETFCESELYEPSGPAIADGFYVLGGTDQGLEVAGDRYRYYDEMGEQDWQPIEDLTSIADGVIFDGQNYWCSLTNNEAGVCTATGWKTIEESLSEQEDQ